MKKINFIFTILFALLGISQAWAGQAYVYAYSSPQTGGYVKVQTSDVEPSSYLLLADNATQGSFGSSGDKTFYLYYQTKPGYNFQNWYKTNESNYNSKSTLTNTSSLTSQGQSVKQSATGIGAQNSYYACVFIPISYYFAFHADDATEGSMANQEFKYDVAQNLSANAFARSYTVTYNTDGGTCDEVSATADYTFAGWATSANGAVVYTDGQNLNNLTTVENTVFDLYAKWNSVAVTLPTATKEGALFNGWYNGDTWVGKAGDSFIPSEDVELTAHWVDKLIPQFVLDKTEIELDQKAVLTLSNVNNPTIQIAPEGIVEYNKENGELTGIGVGEVTITVTQAGTTTIEGKSEELKLNVTKKTPSLAVLLADVEQATITLNPTQSASVAFNVVSDTVVEVSPVSGSDYVAYNEGVATALDKEGTAVFRATLPETDTYKGASVDFSVEVAFGAEATGVYVLENQSDEKKCQYGNTCHEHTWSDENAAGVVRFQVSYVTASIDPGYKVQQLLNGEWVDVTDKKTDHTTSYTWKQETLNRAAKGVRFWGSGSLNNYFKNISVTKALYVEAETAEIQTAPTVDGEGTLTVKYSIANGGDLKISCDNGKFTLDSYTVANVVNKSGTVNIPVTFAAQDVECDDTANVVIYNGVYRAEIKLMAKVRKGTPEITTLPTAAEITFGQKLSESALTGGEASVEGTFAWADGDEELNAGEYDREVIFTPSNSEAYNTTTCSVHVIVNQAETEIGDLEEPIELEEGQELNDEVLEKIKAAFAKLFGWIEDLFTLKFTATDPGEAAVEDTEYEVEFTPADTNYAPATKAVPVKVNRVAAVPTGWENIESGEKAIKVMVNGQVFIIRGDKVYTINGLEVR